MAHKPHIRTIEEAHAFVLAEKVVTIFSPNGVPLPSLWDTVDLPEKQPGEKGWGEKVSAIWTWKNELPARWPEEIFYGKIKGGHAVLMTLDHLREMHFATAYQPVEKLKPLARYLYDHIRQEPYETGPLRQLAMAERGVSKSQVETALKQLQISLNIVRDPDPASERDRWLTFADAYPEIWAAGQG